MRPWLGCYDGHLEGAPLAALTAALPSARLKAVTSGLSRDTSQEHEAFRLETLDRYAVPGEAGTVRRYLAGAPHEKTGFARSWAGYVADMVARGVTYHRVHIVQSPAQRLPPV